RIHLLVPPFPTRRSSDLQLRVPLGFQTSLIIQITRNKPKRKKKGTKQNPTTVVAVLEQRRRLIAVGLIAIGLFGAVYFATDIFRSEEHTSELQSREKLVC